MTLASGVYAPLNAKRVFHWPEPDFQGDAEQVTVPKLDPNGNVIGTNFAMDAFSRPVRKYQPPKGFRNLPSFDHTDNYVMHDERGNIVRTPTGEAVNIVPGQTLIIHPDGGVEYLNDDYERYLFQKAHDYVGALDDPLTKTENEVATPVAHVPQPVSSVPDSEREQFEAWLREQNKGA